MLYGSGEQPITSDYKFFNSFGKEFAGKFDKKRLNFLNKNGDHPIDMNFMEKLNKDQIKRI